MGEWLKRKRAKRFKHLASAARAQLLEEQNLFSSFPEVLRRVFNCTFITGREKLGVGDIVIVVDQGDPLVRVLYDQSLVGYVDASGSQSLRESLFTVEAAQNMIVGKVKSIGLLTKSFAIVLNDSNTP
jgi:hypothetical protein